MIVYPTILTTSLFRSPAMFVPLRRLLLLVILLHSIPISRSSRNTDFSCDLPIKIENGGANPLIEDNQILEFYCKTGYHLNGSSRVHCNDFWKSFGGNNKPKCVSVKCPYLMNVEHGKLYYLEKDMNYNDTLRVTCNSHYTIYGERSTILKCDIGGNWIFSDGEKKRVICRKNCPLPPTIRHSQQQYSYDDSHRIIYSCVNGYRLQNSRVNQLICNDGEWHGTKPVCVLDDGACGRPENIINGYVLMPEETYLVGTKVKYYCHRGYKMQGLGLIECSQDNQWTHFRSICVPIKGGWLSVDGDPSSPNKFLVGNHVKYICNHGHRIKGSVFLNCTTNYHWSSNPPQCLFNVVAICSDLGILHHGSCSCYYDNCEPYRIHTRLFCRCDEGFKMDGYHTLTCMENKTWDNNLPRCLSVTADTSVDDSASHMSTLAIVVATSCSVLGSLLVIMFIVMMRHRKSQTHLCHAAPPPLPYTRVHSNSLDEHDRLALIAYVESAHARLPTYEEAVRSQRSMLVSTTDTLSNSRSGPIEYRPLPNIPTNIHVSSMSTSTATTNMVNRDMVLDVSGSLDTVNVSMSDASTSATIETFDSGASNPSMASRRATAGSLDSFSGSLVPNGDVPLLDNRGDSDTGTHSDRLEDDIKDN